MQGKLHFSSFILIQFFFRAGKITSLKKVKKFESNISNGRKIFRLLLWLNEIDGMHEILNNTKL